MPKSPMTATMKSKPFISSVIPKVRRSWPVTMSSPAEARMKPMQDRDQRLDRVAAAQADERREGEELDREELGRAELERDLGQQRGEERDQHDREERAHERGGEGGGERLAPLPLPRHRIAVEGGGHRPRLARDVEEDRRDGAAEERAPVEAREQDDGRGRRHREGERQQDRHAVGAAQARQHADDGAERDAERPRAPRLYGWSATWKPRNRFSQPTLSTRARPRAGPWAWAPGTTSRRPRRSAPGTARSSEHHRRPTVAADPAHVEADEERRWPRRARGAGSATTKPAAGSSVMSTGLELLPGDEGRAARAGATPAAPMTAEDAMRKTASQNGKNPLCGPVGAPADAQAQRSPQITRTPPPSGSAPSSGRRCARPGRADGQATS